MDNIQQKKKFKGFSRLEKILISIVSIGLLYNFLSSDLISFSKIDNSLVMTFNFIPPKADL